MNDLIRKLLLFSLFMAGSSIFAQPYDLIYPTTESPDTVTQELRALQEIERDVAIEKLTRYPNKVDAYVEMADLRRIQGKLQEAKRFYQMALKISPDHYLANQGLMMTYYQLGEFQEARTRADEAIQLKPMSLDAKAEYDFYRKRLQDEYKFGTSIYEDDRKLLETMYFLEGNFHSNTAPKFETNLRYEKWTFDDKKYKIDLNVFQLDLRYNFNDNTNIGIDYIGEVFSRKETLNGCSFDGTTGSDNLKLAVRYKRGLFRENTYTIHNRYTEDILNVSLFGDLHPKTRLIQSFSNSEISDNNTKRRYETELVHTIFKKKEPFLTASVRYYQSSYEFQMDVDGNYLKYWAPSDYKGGEFCLAWEKTVNPKFWWGIDAKYTYNKYRFDTVDDVKDSGAGASIYCNYKIAGGNVFASFGDKINSYFRERRLDIQGCFYF